MPLDIKKDDMGDVIKDFYKSKAPQFKGKSKEKRRQMAIAAKLEAERGPLDVDEACWKGYEKKGMKTMFGKRYPNCVKKKKKVAEESNPRIPRKKGQPANSKKHSDLYTDENPKGTIHGLGFKDVDTAKASVSKIRNSSRSHAHKIQAAVAMEQRAREMGKTAEAAVYRKFINSMKKKTKKMNEEMNGKCKAGYYYCYTDKKCKPIPKGFRVVGPAGMLRKENGHTVDDDSGTKNGNGNGNGNGGNGNGGGVSEETKYDRYDKEKKKFAKADQKMKFGNFVGKAKEAKERLRPGEVKRYDKELGKYVSNKG